MACGCRSPMVTCPPGSSSAGTPTRQRRSRRAPAKRTWPGWGAPSYPRRRPSPGSTGPEAWARPPPPFLFALRRNATYSWGEKRPCQFSWRRPGAGLRVLPGSQRLSSSKGLTRRKPGSQSHGPSAAVWQSCPADGGRQVAEGMGRRTARPSPGASSQDGSQRARATQGSVVPVTRRLAPLFFLSPPPSRRALPRSLRRSPDRRLTPRTPARTIKARVQSDGA